MVAAPASDELLQTRLPQLAPTIKVSGEAKSLGSPHRREVGDLWQCEVLKTSPKGLHSFQREWCFHDCMRIDADLSLERQQSARSPQIFPNYNRFQTM